MMNKQDLLKIQSCVLKVNIHCDGCEHNVKKLLQKIEGVYSVNVDAEQGKVVVTGNVDPGKLIKKLKSSGKHAELWGPKGMTFPTNQFRNLQIDHHVHGKGAKDNKSQKGGGQQPQMFQFQNKGPTNFKLPAKDQKSVKFNLPEEEFDASDDQLDDDFDDYEDSEDDFDEEHVHGHAMPNKMMMGHRGNNGGGGNNAKKIDVMDVVQNKGKNGGKGGQKGHEGGGKKHKSGGGNKKSSKTSGGLLGRFLGFGQKGGDKNKDKKKKEGGGEGGTGNNKKSKEGKKMKKKKKGGDKYEDEGYDFDDDDDDLDEFDIPQSRQGKSKGKGGKGGNGGKSSKGKGQGNNGNVGQMGPIQMGQMDQMRNLMQGLPVMNGVGYYPGMQMQPAAPQYQPQQQYMAPMISHNYQQQPHLNSMYPPPTMMYGRPYMPPPPPIPVHPGTDPVTHAFNDENTEGCTVM